MSIYWDQTTCNITNDTGFQLSVANIPNLDHGEYATYPRSVWANTTADVDFVVQSTSGSEIGPAGSLTFGLPDGTQLNISFDQEFAVGQQSSFTAALSGARAGSYGLTISNDWNSWHGQGARWVVSLTLSPNAGASSVSCSYTR